MKTVITQQRVENMFMYFTEYICIAHALICVYACAGVCTYITMCMNIHRKYLTQNICALIFWKFQSQKAQTLLQIAVDLGNPACVQPGRDDKVFPVLSIPKDTSVTE